MLDELQFSGLSKGDFVVLMRLKHVRQTLSFNSSVLVNIINSYLKHNKIKIKCKAIEKRA